MSRGERSRENQRFPALSEAGTQIGPGFAPLNSRNAYWRVLVPSIAPCEPTWIRLGFCSSGFGTRTSSTPSL